MPRPFSASKIDRLGERLVGTESPSDDDMEMLQRVRLAYDQPMVMTKGRLLDRLGLHATDRLKTENTIIEKVRRKTRLSSMQDIAGLRIVEDVGLVEQDELVGLISGVFPGAKVVDRRDKPMHGYRAVHVIPRVEGLPVEVQVRTLPQDGWAQLFERLADMWGRQIRYGEPPDGPDEIFISTEEGGEQLTRAEMVKFILTLSDSIGQIEAYKAGYPGELGYLKELDPEQQAVFDALYDGMRNLGKSLRRKES
jgi:hypothetical protein